MREKEKDRRYKVLVKVRNDNPYLPPSKHLDTLELPKGRHSPVEDEEELVSLLYLVYEREMRVSLQVSRGGFKTVYKAAIEPVFEETRRERKRLCFLRCKTFKERLDYYLDIEPVYSIEENESYWMKIEDPESLIPPEFLKKKREEFQDYENGSWNQSNKGEKL